MRAKVLPSQERLKQVLDYNPETGVLTWLDRVERGFSFNNRVAGTRGRQLNGSPSGKMISVDAVRYKVSRVIWVMVYGSLPEGHEIDHANGNPWDDRLCNLRLATHDQNKANRRSMIKSKTGLKGVTARKNGKFQSCLKFNRKKYFLGTFNTAEEAAKAYADFSMDMFGEFSFEARNSREITLK
mgnify:CR=1 FL=1